jgi:hypothetical protein
MPCSAKVNADKAASLWQGRFEIREQDQQLSIQFDSAEQCLPFMAHLNEIKHQPSELRINPLSVEKAYQTLIQEERA